MIPLTVREALGLEPGTPFSVTAEKDSILLKKMEKPVLSWSQATKPFREAAKKAKLTENDVEKLIAEIRGRKR